MQATDALSRLKEGNARFLNNQSTQPRASEINFDELAQGQSPFAIVLSCADSRVPAEIIFDQGFGDIFVVRVAGNLVTPTQLGSIEYAVSSFATPLLIVLGHSQCGAVSATLATMDDESADLSVGLRSIVDTIAPALRALEAPSLESAINANIKASVAALTEQSDIISEAVAAGKLQVVGAHYNIENGEVDFAI